MKTNSLIKKKIVWVNKTRENCPKVTKWKSLRNQCAVFGGDSQNQRKRRKSLHPWFCIVPMLKSAAIVPPSPCTNLVTQRHYAEYYFTFNPWINSDFLVVTFPTSVANKISYLIWRISISDLLFKWYHSCYCVLCFILFLLFLLFLCFSYL